MMETIPTNETIMRSSNQQTYERQMTEYHSIREEVLYKLKTCLPEIQEKFGIETIGIFGSVSRGEDGPESDVDVLYAFTTGHGGMHDMANLKYYLEDLFGREVGLVSLKYVSPLIRDMVAADAILYGQEMSIA